MSDTYELQFDDLQATGSKHQKRNRITKRFIENRIADGGTLEGLPAHFIHSGLFKLLKVNLTFL
jgi:hypothetical protein